MQNCKQAYMPYNMKRKLPLPWPKPRDLGGSPGNGRRGAPQSDRFANGPSKPCTAHQRLRGESLQTTQQSTVTNDYGTVTSQLPHQLQDEMSRHLQKSLEGLKAKWELEVNIILKYGEEKKLLNNNLAWSIEKKTSEALQILPDLFAAGKSAPTGLKKRSEGDREDSDNVSSEGDADDDNDSPNESSGEGPGENGNAEKESENPNAGWAEAMARILLKKTPESKTAILLKNKELEKVKAKEKQERLERRKQVDKKRQWEMMCRVKPDVVTDRETERNFQRIATRGVVQLFNAVRKHQTNIDEKVKETGGSERKRAKLLSSVSKKDFIDVLRGNKSEKQSKAEKGKQVEVKSEDKTSWNILRDDFMMGATMKDWDKESDEGQAGEAHGEEDNSFSD
ncbi:RRP15-like protein [Acipenser ruthenus]|uniref:RRP15-like protein n=1 Tax=Acipenser ruthenus TaxID=7906 RepID=A0A662YY18_ACIRT|nr:RRP15-like protein [Acipenser ruthenus]